MKETCKHTSTSTGPSRAYNGSVASLGNENTMAHGGRTYTETCSCGMERHVNTNGQHVETGDWHSSVPAEKPSGWLIQPVNLGGGMVQAGRKQ